MFSVAFRHKPGVANLGELKCILDRSADVVARQSVEFNGGRVFFCCADCRSEFDPANPDHLAAANWQLVASGQFGQIGCPFSGQEILEEAMTPVGGVEVGFCNTGCRDKVQNATDDLERTGMVFNSEAFTRGFSRIVDSPQPADR